MLRTRWSRRRSAATPSGACCCAARAAAGPAAGARRGGLLRGPGGGGAGGGNPSPSRCQRDPGWGYVDIPGARYGTYALQFADEHGHVRLKVTAANPDRTVAAYSNAVGPVAA